MLLLPAQCRGSLVVSSDLRSAAAKDAAAAAAAAALPMPAP
jgi:hypothetical protein